MFVFPPWLPVRRGIQGDMAWRTGEPMYVVTPCLGTFFNRYFLGAARVRGGDKLSIGGFGGPPGAKTGPKDPKFLAEHNPKAGLMRGS